MTVVINGTTGVTFPDGSTQGTAGGLGLRNILLNGDFRVNQRAFNGTWSGLTDGAYGYDRWKKSGTNIQQVVEAGNFLPSTVYTLSGTGVTTQQLTSPDSGNWTVTVPNTASKIQLEQGYGANPFELRPYGLELALCQRYYETANASFYAPYSVGTVQNMICGPWKVQKRVQPTMVISAGNFNSAIGYGVDGWFLGYAGATVGAQSWNAIFSGSAEL